MSILPLGSEQDGDRLPASAFPPLAGAASPLPNSAESGELGDYVQIALHHWRFILAATVLGCLCGLFIAWLQTPLYRANASLEIQSINGDFLNMKQARPMDDNQQGTDALTDLQTQIEILQSDMLAQNTRKSLKQKDVFKKLGIHPKPATRAKSPDGEPLSPEDAVFASIADTLKVRSVGQTRIIRVQVDAPHPRLAADYANTLLTEYIHQNTKARWQMAEAAGEYTRGQLAETRRKLEASEQALQKYAGEHQLVFSTGRQNVSNVSEDRLHEVQADLLHARADLVDKEARRQVATATGSDAIPEVAKDNDLQQLRSKLIDLQRQQAELAIIFKPDYSEVKKVQAQIDELQAAIGRERNRILTRIGNEYDESTARVKLLTGAYDDAMQRAVKEAQTAVQYDILKRDVDTDLSDYQAMLVRSKELNLAAAIQTSNIRVIDNAKPPARPYSPKLPLNMALGMFSGLSLAVAYTLVRDRSNQNLRYPGESMLRLGVPELAVIASTDGITGKLKNLAFRKNTPALEGGVAKAAGGDDFRALLASIFFSGAQGKEPKLVVVTSCAPQDGKTTVASNLSVALARAGKSVLLIDGDLRRPQIHNIFGLPNNNGLGSLLQDCRKPNEAQRAVLNTSIPGLSVLTSGASSSGPADLLFDPHLRVLLTAYRENFDMVIVDTPPMMRIPDARLLGRHADAVVLVARANRTPRSTLLMARQRLALDHTKLLGVVLNDCDVAGSPYRYET